MRKKCAYELVGGYNIVYSNYVGYCTRYVVFEFIWNFEIRILICTYIDNFWWDMYAAAGGICESLRQVSDIVCLNVTSFLDVWMFDDHNMLLWHTMTSHTLVSVCLKFAIKLNSTYSVPLNVQQWQPCNPWWNKG